MRLVTIGDEIQYPQESNQCPKCGRELPKLPFSGIGWRDVCLNPPSKERTKICNDCFKEFRKEHPPTKREINIPFWNKIIIMLILLVVVYGFYSFMSFGIGKWSYFLAGSFVYILVIIVFLNLFYGIINKKIEFKAPVVDKTKTKPKYEFNFPGQNMMKSPFQKSEPPKTLEYNTCDYCGEEKIDEDLFIKQDGSRVCLDCIKGGEE